MRLPQCLSVLAVALTLCHQSHAHLVWFANFESYDAKNGATPLRLAQDGAPETFTSTTSSSPEAAATTCEVVLGPNGNALSLSVAAKAPGAATLRILQSALGDKLEEGVLIVSFDAQLTGKMGLSIVTEARTLAVRSGKTLHVPLSRENKTASMRFFIVINQSGVAIPLPGGMGDVPDKSMASYSFDGTTYSKVFLSDGDVLTLPIGGFLTGISKNNLSVGAELSALFDNFGAWTSLSDKLNDVSVMSLSPGTAVSKP